MDNVARLTSQSEEVPRGVEDVSGLAHQPATTEITSRVQIRHEGRMTKCRDVNYLVKLFLLYTFVQLWLKSSLSTSLLPYFECNWFLKKETKHTINKVKCEVDWLHIFVVIVYSYFDNSRSKIWTAVTHMHIYVYRQADLRDSDLNVLI